jgi:hypothetical protein
MRDSGWRALAGCVAESVEVSETLVIFYWIDLPAVNVDPENPDEMIKEHFSTARPCAAGPGAGAREGDEEWQRR